MVAINYVWDELSDNELMEGDKLGPKPLPHTFSLVPTRDLCGHYHWHAVVKLICGNDRFVRELDINWEGRIC